MRDKKPKIATLVFVSLFFFAFQKEAGAYGDDGLPFARGDMELGVGLGGAGDGDSFLLAVGGNFAYYVLNRLAPGIEVQYVHVFSDIDYPESMTVLPFVKFVLIRSTRFAPYLVAAGGREFEWGSDYAVDAWIAGGGAGAHIGIGEHFAIKLQLMALYYWYDETKVLGYEDSIFTQTDYEGRKYAEFACGNNICVAYEDEDSNDIDGKLFFPLISIGMAFYF